MALGTGQAGRPGQRRALIRQRKRTDYCQLHLSSPFYRGQGPRLAYPALDNPRRNRIIPMNEMALLWGSAALLSVVLCCLISFVAGGFAPAGATGGFPIAPLTPSARTLPCCFGNTVTVGSLVARSFIVCAKAASRLLVVLPECAADVAVGVALGDGVALVVFRFAAAKTQL